MTEYLNSDQKDKRGLVIIIESPLLPTTNHSFIPLPYT